MEEKILEIRGTRLDRLLHKLIEKYPIAASLYLKSIAEEAYWKWRDNVGVEEETQLYRFVLSDGKDSILEI